MALIIVAVAIFFGCVLAYLGAAGKLNGVAAELKAKQQRVADSRKTVQSLEASRLNYLDTRAQIRCLESSVSTQAYVPTLLRQLEHLGKSVQLRVVSVRPQAEPMQTTRSINSGAQAADGNVEAASQEKAAGTSGAKVAEKPYKELKIDLEVEGCYMNTLDFLYRLTSFPKIVAVNAVDISPASSMGQVRKSPTLKIKINMTAFVFKDEGTGADMGAVPASAASGKNPTSEGRTDNEAG